MEDGATLKLTMADYFDAQCAVRRLNEAYEGTRQWEMQVRRGLIQITHSNSAAL